MGDVPKLKRDGKVAVIYSPGFGAGWSTWADGNAEAVLFDPELAEMLERTASNLSQETERRAMTMTSLLEPALILLMGAVVLVIVLAVLLPIIEINTLVK